MCNLLKVSTSGYYKYLPQGLSSRDVMNIALDQEITALFKQYEGIYGYRRIYREITMHASLNRVRRRMIALGLYAVIKKKYQASPKSCVGTRYAANLLDQDLNTTAPNQKWISDITEMKVNARKLYLAVIIDLYSRKVIGWSMSNRMTAELACDALRMAMRNRGYPNGVMLHSDRGSQYTSKIYQTLLTAYGLICSMSAKGCCYDNAACESFFATLKKEHVYRNKFSSWEAAKSSIFKYIEVFYNRIRLHSSIEYLSPLQFESKQLAIAA